MKKNRKLIILSLLCVSLFAVTLSGCGKKKESEKTTTTTVTATEQKTTEPDTTEPQTTEPAGKTFEENSLVAYYSFDDSNNFILDDSGNDLILSSLGTRYHENGKKNGGVYFDGSSAGLALPSEVFQASGFTFACWVNLDEDLPFARVLNAGGTIKYFFLITSNNNDTYNEYGTAFKFRNGDDNVWYVANTGADADANKAAAHVTPGEWTHLAFTLQDGTAKLYCNGTLVAEYTGINCTMADFASEGTYLGRSAFDTDPSLKGYMDEVYFYNYALDDAAITELMNK